MCSFCLPLYISLSHLAGLHQKQSPSGSAPICQGSCCYVAYLKLWQNADFGLSNWEISFMQTAALEPHSEFSWCCIKEDGDHMPDIWGKKAKYVRQCVMSCTQGRSEKSAFQNAFCSLENDSHSVINGLYSTLGWCLYFTVKTFPPELLQHPFEQFGQFMWWADHGQEMTWYKFWFQFLLESCRSWWWQATVNDTSAPFLWAFDIDGVTGLELRHEAKIPNLFLFITLWFSVYIWFKLQQKGIEQRSWLCA